MGADGALVRLALFGSHLRNSPPPATRDRTSPWTTIGAAAPSQSCGTGDLAAFRADGFLLLRGLVPPEELEAVDRDSMALIERGLAGRPLGDARWNYGEDPANRSSPPISRRINGLSDEDMPPSFRLLLAYPPLLAVVAALMADANGPSRAFAAGVPGALVFKVPFNGFPVPWHQDPVAIKRFPAFNLDVYLDDSDEENACVWAIPGSHLGGYHQGTEAAAAHVASWTGGKEGAEVVGAVPVQAQRGDVLIHATSVLHGSGWNRSPRLRRTLYYHFDSWEDVNLGGGYTTRSSNRSGSNAGAAGAGGRMSFGEAMHVTHEAVQLRKSARPSEKAFPFRYPAPSFD